MKLNSELNNKRQSHPEIYILLTLGIKPEILIRKGYSKATIYAYNRKVKDVRERLNKLIS